jgi:plastocyanin
MTKHTAVIVLLCTTALVAGFSSTIRALTTELPKGYEVTAQLSGLHTLNKPHSSKNQALPAVLWLNPTDTHVAPPEPRGNYTLLQKNKMFTPHLLVVPVGSTVMFPNADPFFHNVFSLFDGKRFDLGLYEAGTSKAVVFSREGVSYIFCNIHSQMSAVVIAMATPYYAVADVNGVFHLHDVPSGKYEMHIWIEGQRQPMLDQLTKLVRVTVDSRDLGKILIDDQQGTHIHLNKFGQPYDPDTKPDY